MHLSTVSWISVTLWLLVSILFILMPESITCKGKPVENVLVRFVVSLLTIFFVSVACLFVGFMGLAPIIEQVASHWSPFSF